MVLKLLLNMAVENGAQRIQIFDDLQNVVNWLNGTNSLENYNIQPIF
jgi:hypothetical protein